jgi:hypothetical protein
VSYRYPDLLTAAKGLLCDAVAVAQESGKEFVVIGGWSPYLLNSGVIPHPGTRDVDLLFERGSTVGELEEVVRAFLQHGYLTSAKHPFQLLRAVSVHDRDFVFNVDFLHSAEKFRSSELFVDHLLLEDSPLLYRYQSIVVPMSSLLFEDCGRTTTTLEHYNPDGEFISVKIPLMNELGALLTKSESMTNPKRTRDAFDVLLAIIQARNCDELLDGIVENCIGERLEKLWALVTDPRLRKNISIYWPEAENEDSWASTTTKVVDFLDDAGIEKPNGEER